VDKPWGFPTKQCPKKKALFGKICHIDKENSFSNVDTEGSFLKDQLFF